MRVPLPQDEDSLVKMRSEKFVRIPVRTKSDSLAFCKVDPIDSHFRHFSWSQAPGGYPRRSTKKLRGFDEQEAFGEKWKTKTLYLHKEIAGLEQGDPTFQVHHANHDVLDCRRVNLWLCTPAFNARHQKRSLRSMLEELWETPRESLEFWPLGDKRRALAHLLELHVRKHGSFPLEFIPSNVIDKIPDPPQVKP